MTQIAFGKDQRPLEPMEQVGLSLYRTTLLLELFPATLRFAVYWGGFWVLGALTPIDLPLTLIALALAGWPLLWSALAFRFPGRGDRWHHDAGARRATIQEAERIHERMSNPPNHPSEILKMEIFVIEDQRKFGGSLGGATILSTGLIWSEYLESVLDHEGNHTLSLDARLSEALRRLRPWGNPLAAAENDRKAEHDPHTVRWFQWLLIGAGGGFGQWVLDLAWSWYWREREYEADARAVVTGNGSRLIAYLEAQKEMFDRPRLVAAGRYKHPPVTRGR